MTDRKISSEANLELLFSERLSFQRRGLFDGAERRYRNIIEMQPDFARGCRVASRVPLWGLDCLTRHWLIGILNGQAVLSRSFKPSISCHGSMSGSRRGRDRRTKRVGRGNSTGRPRLNQVSRRLLRKRAISSTRNSHSSEVDWGKERS